MIGHRPSLRTTLAIHAVFTAILAAGALSAPPATAAPVPAGGAATALQPGAPINLAAFDRSERRVRLPDGITLGYVDRGPRDGRPVVLIHGYTNDARNWAPLLPYLDPRLRLVLVDLRGHGESSKPACCYARIDMAYDVRLLMDHLKIRKADVIGHSLGSIVAQTFAETWPQRVRSVVLISSTGGYRAGCPNTTPADAPPLPQLRAALLRQHDPIDPDGQFMSDWYGTTKPADPELLRLQRRDAARIPVRVWLAILDQAVTGIDLQTTLPRLEAPTLLLWGAKDTLMGEADRCSLMRALPHAEVKVFKDYGHNPFWQDPAAVAAAINPFLART